MRLDKDLKDFENMIAYKDEMKIINEGTGGKKEVNEI